MSRLLGWIKRIPVWVWLFLAVTQVATIVGASHRLSRHLEPVSDPEIQTVFDRLDSEDRTNLLVASIAGSIFVVLGFWRWRSGKTAAGGGDTPKKEATRLPETLPRQTLNKLRSP